MGIEYVLRVVLCFLNGYLVDSLIFLPFIIIELIKTLDICRGRNEIVSVYGEGVMVSS